MLQRQRERRGGEDMRRLACSAHLLGRLELRLRLGKCEIIQKMSADLKPMASKSRCQPPIFRVARPATSPARRSEA